MEIDTSLNHKHIATNYSFARTHTVSPRLLTFRVSAGQSTAWVEELYSCTYPFCLPRCLHFLCVVISTAYENCVGYRSQPHKCDLPLLPRGGQSEPAQARGSHRRRHENSRSQPRLAAGTSHSHYAYVFVFVCGCVCVCAWACVLCPACIFGASGFEVLETYLCFYALIFMFLLCLCTAKLPKARLAGEIGQNQHQP